MPESTLEELASRVAELEYQIAVLKALPQSQPGTTAAPGDDLTARVKHLEE
jgi:hypothetical protein